MKRYGSVIKVKPEALAEYKRYHAAVWPDILDMIKKCNIRNYSIYLKDDFLFGYFEYHGTDYKADMAKMADLLLRSAFDDLQSYGHQVKGSARSYGFERLGQIGASLEEAARQQDRPRTSEALSLMDDHLRAVRLAAA